MTRTLPNRFVAALFAGALMIGAWLPTVTVPVQFAAADSPVELA